MKKRFLPLLGAAAWYSITVPVDLYRTSSYNKDLDNSCWMELSCASGVMNTIGPSCMGDIEGPRSTCERLTDKACTVLFPSGWVSIRGWKL